MAELNSITTITMAGVNDLLIQKITVGLDPKNGFSYTVGKPAYVVGFEISRIEEVKPDEVYHVFVKGNAGEILWKKFLRVPVSVHYDVEGY